MTQLQLIDPKCKLLKQQGALNPKPQKVRDDLFLNHDFFDPKDLVQVKYEMLRRVQKDGVSVSNSTINFGFSRPAFYKALTHFKAEGLVGLIPKKRGPKQAHKLTEEIMQVIEQARREGYPFSDLVQLVKDRFGIEVHLRSIERALLRQKKKSFKRER